MITPEDMKPIQKLIDQAGRAGIKSGNFIGKVISTIIKYKVFAIVLFAGSTMAFIFRLFGRIKHD